MASQQYYYVNTLAAFATVLKGVQPQEDPEGKPTREHLAWMLVQVGHLDRTSLGDAFKAARWVGWMLLASEQLGFWDNARSRALIRADVEAGFDKPTFNKKV